MAPGIWETDRKVAEDVEGGWMFFHADDAGVDSDSGDKEERQRWHDGFGLFRWSLDVGMLEFL